MEGWEERVVWEGWGGGVSSGGEGRPMDEVARTSCWKVVGCTVREHSVIHRLWWHAWWYTFGSFT